MELKIGDKIASQSRWHGYSIVEVTRLTKTQAVLSDGSKIRLPFNGSCTAIGSHGFGSTYYKTLTDEIIKVYEKEEAYKVVKNINFSSLTTQQLNNIIKISKEDK